MKIMQGMREIAGQGYYSVKGLRDSGHDATLVLWDESPAKYPYDYCMKMHRGRRYLYPIYGIRVFWNYLRCARKYDTFHFHFGNSLLPRNLDLAFLKKRGKRVFFESHGSDVRLKSIACKHNSFWENVDLGSEENIRKEVARIVTYADGIIVHDDELLPYFPEGVQPYVVPLRMDLSRFQTFYPNPQKETVTIVHAPSRRAIKGTEYIHKAIEALKEKYLFIDYILVENKTQDEAFRQYQKADIVVDQILAGTYGVFAVEAMAMGKPVITYITEEMKACFPESLPICSASPETIESVLERLIMSPELRFQLGKEGRKYVETYHDCKKIGQVLFDIYNGKVQPEAGRAAFNRVARQVVNEQ